LTSSALPLLDCALPTQNLLSYEANVYRDWVWGECENERTKEIVLALSPDKLGKFIVLGAGAGRLAIDLHVDAKPELTVACDLNPLFLLLLNKLKSGDGIELTEFPLQPKSSEFVAIKHYIDLLKTDLKPAHLDDFHLCFADAAKPAFKRYCFDTVLTPWLIDIQPYDFKVFLIQLNQYLDIAGTWLNIGSLVFNHKRDSLCYQEQEVIEIAAACGFKIERIEQHEIPYLQSPYNAGHRIENMWCWRAIKIKHVLPHTQHQVRPLWLIDHESPIPVSDQIHQNQQNSQYIADMLAAIDGERSIRDISKEMAKQYGSEVEEHQLEVYRYLLSQTQT